jgi:hypothetical protein
MELHHRPFSISPPDLLRKSLVIGTKCFSDEDILTILICLIDCVICCFFCWPGRKLTRLPESRSLHTNVIAPSNQARCSRDIKLSAMQTCCNSVSLHLIFPPTDGSLPVFSKGKRMLYFTRLPRITDASFTASSWANHKYFGKYSHTSLPKENTRIPIRLRSTISSTIIILIMWNVNFQVFPCFPVGRWYNFEEILQPREGSSFIIC